MRYFVIAKTPFLFIKTSVISKSLQIFWLNHSPIGLILAGKIFFPLYLSK